MLNNAWGKADIESSAIQNQKKEIGELFDHLLIKRKVNGYSPVASKCLGGN
jgi:hypothetical protein